MTKLGRHEEAIHDLTRVIDLAPATVAAWSKRGVARVQLGRWDQAVADFRKELELLPGNRHARKRFVK